MDISDEDTATSSIENVVWCLWKYLDANNYDSQIDTLSGSFPWVVAAELPKSNTTGVARVVKL